MLTRFVWVLGCGALLSGCIYYEPVPVQARRPMGGGAVAGEGVSKDDVVRLTRAGISEGTIVSKIKAAGVLARPTSDDVIELSNAGVSEGVIQAMLSARVATTGGTLPSAEVVPYYYPYYYYPAYGWYDNPWGSHHYWDHHDWGHHGGWHHD